MTKQAEAEEVGYVVSASTDLGSGNSLAVTGNLPKGCSLEQMNAEFDKLRSAFNRQQAKSAVIGLGQDIERLAGQKKQVIDTITRLDSKSDAKGGASAAERSQRDAALQNLESLSTNIESKQELLQKLVAEAK